MSHHGVCKMTFLSIMIDRLWRIVSNIFHISDLFHSLSKSHVLENCHTRPNVCSIMNIFFVGNMGFIGIKVFSTALQQQLASSTLICSNLQLICIYLVAHPLIKAEKKVFIPGVFHWVVYHLYKTELSALSVFCPSQSKTCCFVQMLVSGFLAHHLR